VTDARPHRPGTWPTDHADHKADHH
jgi:hypothetical protein